MGKVLPALVVFTLLPGGVGPTWAQVKARRILEKAVKAQGGEANIAKRNVMRVMLKGKVTIPNLGEQEVIIEDTWQMPGQYKHVMETEVNGKKARQTFVVNGNKGWGSLNGQVQAMTAKELAEFLEEKYGEDLDRLAFRKEKGHNLTVLMEIKINGRPAVGVEVESKGHRAVKLYFDKATGMLVKRERQVLGNTGKLETQEVFFSDYKAQDGVPHWRKIAAKLDGKQFIEAKVTEIKFFKKLDNKVFAKP
jgi:hypothetical protein